MFRARKPFVFPLLLILLFVAVNEGVESPVASADTLYGAVTVAGLVTKLLSIVNTAFCAQNTPKPSFPPAPNGSPPLLLSVVLFTSTTAFAPRALIPRFRLLLIVQLSTLMV